MTCPELISRVNRRNANAQARRERATNLDNFSSLHRDGRELITEWFERAWQERECPPERSFKPFIFAWFAFNGWSACVTMEDQDYQIMKKLKLSEVIQNDFNRICNDSDSSLQEYLEDFYQLFPVFKVQEIRSRGLRFSGIDDRGLRTQYYFNNNLTEYQPRCYRIHQQNQEPIPRDWQHTLSVIYQVRCNLFHGDKSMSSEEEQRIVCAAFRVLVTFIHDAHYIEVRS